MCTHLFHKQPKRQQSTRTELEVYIDSPPLSLFLGTGPLISTAIIPRKGLPLVSSLHGESSEVKPNHARSRQSCGHPVFAWCPSWSESTRLQHCHFWAQSPIRVALAFGRQERSVAVASRFRFAVAVGRRERLVSVASRPQDSMGRNRVSKCDCTIDIARNQRRYRPMPVRLRGSRR
jgi:hypothetical protein